MLLAGLIRFIKRPSKEHQSIYIHHFLLPAMQVGPQFDRLRGYAPGQINLSNTLVAVYFAHNRMLLLVGLF